jgi:hypothetical protein
VGENHVERDRLAGGLGDDIGGRNQLLKVRLCRSGDERCGQRHDKGGHKVDRILS